MSDTPPHAGPPREALFLDLVGAALDEASNTGAPIAVALLSPDDEAWSTGGPLDPEILLADLEDNVRRALAEEGDLHALPDFVYGIVLTGFNDDAVRETLERVRHAVEGSLLQAGAGWVAVTVSIGCACADSFDATAEELVRLAEEALECALHHVGNRVVSTSPRPARRAS